MPHTVGIDRKGSAIKRRIARRKKVHTRKGDFPKGKKGMSNLRWRRKGERGKMQRWTRKS